MCQKYVWLTHHIGQVSTSYDSLTSHAIPPIKGDARFVNLV